MTARLSVTDLAVKYGQNLALSGVSVEFTPGTITGILGPNGAGKSTFFKSVLGLIAPASGTITLDDKPLKIQLARIGYVPQHSSVDWDFPATGFDVALMGSYGAIRNKKAALQATTAALKLVGATDFCSKTFGELSGGQKQRIFLARSLVKSPDLVLLDEPFQGVDAPTEAAIMETLKQLRNLDKTIIMIHHDLSSAADYFDRVCLINRTLIAHDITAQVLTRENIARTYQAPESSEV